MGMALVAEVEGDAGEELSGAGWELCCSGP